MSRLHRLIRIVVATGAFWAALGALPRAYAANPGAITLSVTPSVTYGVSITSVSAVGYDFTTVALGGTTVSTTAIVLTNTGDVSEYFSLAVTNTSGNWSAVSTVPTTDQFRLSAILNNNTQPNASSFSSPVTNPPVPLNAAGLYGQSSQTPAGTTKNLWLRLEMPPAILNGGTNSQTMTLMVNGQGT